MLFHTQVVSLPCARPVIRISTRNVCSGSPAILTRGDMENKGHRSPSPHHCISWLFPDRPAWCSDVSLVLFGVDRNRHPLCIHLAPPCESLADRLSVSSLGAVCPLPAGLGCLEELCFGAPGIVLWGLRNFVLWGSGVHIYDVNHIDVF